MQFRELWSINNKEQEQSFHPPSVNARCDYGATGTRWHCTINENYMTKAPKHLNLAMAIGVGAGGNKGIDPPHL